MISLFKHQEEAANWLMKNGSGLIWAATGVGKTLIAATYAERLMMRSGRFRVLIICPSSVRYQWQAELKKYYSIGACVIEGTPTVRKTLWENNVQYKIVNYELLLKDYKYALPLDWDLVIADECHRLANARAKTVRIIKKLNARFRVALSATPICNGKYDLFSQADWIKPGCLGQSWWSFRQEYCVMHAAFPKIIGYRNSERFDRITAPLIFRIGKEVLSDLPPISESVVPFMLSLAERKIYDRAKDELRIELEGRDDITILNALTKLLRLRQICNGSRSLSGGPGLSSKLSTLMDLLSDILEDETAKVIIFTSFAETARDYYPDLSAKWQGSRITGETSQDQRAVELSKFENEASQRFLLGTEALSTGLNIQAANFIIHVDEPWSYSKYDQRNGRAWRQGQKRHVQVYSLIAQKTVDEYVHKVIEGKKSEVDITWNNINEILK